ncbi:hypothetical protein N566_02505 [Streptomycetaceae bacterium MP113-05]|nr:hypothetical protein N566_02505 [Streptomycetaceae bacterium MP113-05]
MMFVSILASDVTVDNFESVVFLAFLFVGAVIFFLHATLTYISLRSDYLIVRNLGHRKRIDMRGIISLRSGCYGMEILCSQG